VNLRKHGVDFLDAIRALEDPESVEEVDDAEDYGEERYRTLGEGERGVLLVVNVLVTAETTRIISARRATRHEQARYYQQR